MTTPEQSRHWSSRARWSAIAVFAFASFSAVAVYSWMGYDHEQRMVSWHNSAAKLAQLGLACLQYSDDNNGHLPRLDTLQHFKDDTLPYTKSNDLYYNTYPREFFKLSPRYSNLSSNIVPKTAILLYDPIGVNGKYVVVLGDFRRVTLSAAEFSKRLAE